MSTEMVDYESAYQDLSDRVDRICKEVAETLKRDPRSAKYAVLFDALEGIGASVLVRHIKDQEGP